MRANDKISGVNGFNNNIRCIEMVHRAYAQIGWNEFNNNIRCIEILIPV